MPHLVLLAIVVLLSGCATDPPAEGSAQESSGPTVYGRLGASVDHVSTP
jgi:hypothetical protein